MSQSQQEIPAPTEPDKPAVEPATSLQPHQIALWASLATVIMAFLIPEVMIPLTFVAAWPVHVILGEFSFGGPWRAFLALVAMLVVLYFEWYLPIKLWALASRRLRWIFVGYTGLCLVTWWGLSAYQSRVDWTSRGLNPDRPGFEPQVVVLAGEVATQRGRAYFEIRMRGWDCYYLKQWKGRPPKPGSWTFMEMAWHGEGVQRSMRHGRHGSRGGGGGIIADEQAILVARRLWDGDRFVGVLKEDEPAKDRRFAGASEVFADMFTYGRWRIPRQIEFTRGDGREEVYHIRKVEFRTEPSETWFENMKRKYLEHDSDLQRRDLGEPPSQSLPWP